MNLGISVAVSLLVAAGLAMAPPVQADTENTQAFLDEMHASGFVPLGSESFWVMNAWSQCEVMDGGTPPADVVKSILEANPDITEHDAGVIVALAVRHFCPSHLLAERPS